MKHFLMVSLLLCSNILLAKTGGDSVAHRPKPTKGQSRLYPYYTNQQYFDSKSVKKSKATEPFSILQPRNTWGYRAGVHFQRTTRYGWILGTGLGYGTRRYDIILHRNFIDFDPDAEPALASQTFTQRMQINVNYLYYNLYTGYNQPLKNGWSIDVTGGVAMKMFYDGMWGQKDFNVEYTSNNGYTQKSVQFASVESQIGRNPNFTTRGIIGRNRFPSMTYTFDSYVGVRRAINKSVTRDIAFGIEANRNWWRWLDDGFMTVRTIPRLDAQMQRHRFYDRNISVGVRVAVGLW